MPMTLTTITNAIRVDYIPGMEPYVFAEDFFTKELEKRQQTENVGYEFEVKVKSSFSEGVNNGGPATALPAARNVNYKKYMGTVKTIRGRIRLLNGLVDYINQDPAKATDLIMDEMDGVQDALRCENERQMLTDAGVTHLCTIASAAVTNETDTWVTITVDDGADGASVKALCGSTYCTRYLRPGMVIDILTSAHGSVSGTATESLEVMDILSNTVFTVKAKTETNAAADTLAGLLADGQLIYHEDGYSATGTYEFYGLKALFGSVTNTIYDADRSTTPNSYIKPVLCYVDVNGLVKWTTPTGTATDKWSTANLHEVMQYLVTTNHASKKDMYLFAEEGISAAYIQKKKSENGYFVETKTIDGWPYEVIEVEGRPMLSPRYMPSNAICIVPMDKMRKYNNRAIDFRETPDGNLWSQVTDLDAVEAYLIGTYEMGCVNFKHGAWIGDLKGQYDA